MDGKTEDRASDLHGQAGGISAFLGGASQFGIPALNGEKGTFVAFLKALSDKQPAAPLLTKRAQGKHLLCPLLQLRFDQQEGQQSGPKHSHDQAKNGPPHAVLWMRGVRAFIDVTDGDQ